MDTVLENWHCRQNRNTGHTDICAAGGAVIAVASQEEDAQKMAAAPPCCRPWNDCSPERPRNTAQEYGPGSPWPDAEALLEELGRQPGRPKCGSIGCPNDARPRLVQTAPGTCDQVCDSCRAHLTGEAKG